MEYRALGRGEIDRIWTIDRSEHIDNIYRVFNGELVLEPRTIDAPGWPADTPPTYTPILYDVFDRGGPFFAAFDGETFAGLAVLDTVWRLKDLLQLEFMHVGRPYRGQGLGKTLFEQAAAAARERGARGLYISATPSEHTVRFYHARGAKVLAEPDPELFALEPEDIHFECPV